MNHMLGTFQVTPQMRCSIEAVLDSGWLSPGERVKEFEEKVAHLHGNTYGVMTNSGTDALRCALLALKEKNGWLDGDVVICPSVTFAATLNVIVQAGLKPMLVDVGMTDFTLNPENLVRRLPEGANRIRAMIPVHFGGRPAKMEELEVLAKRYGWKILEDSCEAAGIEGIGRGDATCFSFYMAHIITTGVGGMAVTRDAELRDLIWSYANHGRRQAGDFTFDRRGYSSRGTEFEAALGLAQLPGLPEVLARRRANARYLYDGLKNADGLRVGHDGRSACLFFPVLLKDGGPAKRDVRAALLESGIESRDLMPLIHQPCYGDLDMGTGFSVAEDLHRNGFYIGCHDGLTQGRLSETVDVLTEILDKSRQVVHS